eukprot:TRINITY_DN61072_c1_g1_i1.p1 TRINITY_DN61072_c1_g1~~TRINITY_DN61072_c1_g1_i1.p1  ORF type:complete len:805 (+),score=29.57 TRINITY_DN61072_c1_g1_i1:120-2534(+)
MSIFKTQANLIRAASFRVGAGEVRERQRKQGQLGTVDEFDPPSREKLLEELVLLRMECVEESHRTTLSKELPPLIRYGLVKYGEDPAVFSHCMRLCCRLSSVGRKLVLDSPIVEGLLELQDIILKHVNTHVYHLQPSMQRATVMPAMHDLVLNTLFLLSSMAPAQLYKGGAIEIVTHILQQSGKTSVALTHKCLVTLTNLLNSDLAPELLSPQTDLINTIITAHLLHPVDANIQAEFASLLSSVTSFENPVIIGYLAKPQLLDALANAMCGCQTIDVHDPACSALCTMLTADPKVDAYLDPAEVLLRAVCNVVKKAEGPPEQYYSLWKLLSTLCQFGSHSKRVDCLINEGVLTYLFGLVRFLSETGSASGKAVRVYGTGTIAAIADIHEGFRKMLVTTKQLRAFVLKAMNVDTSDQDVTLHCTRCLWAVLNKGAPGLEVREAAALIGKIGVAGLVHLLEPANYSTNVDMRNELVERAVNVLGVVLRKVMDSRLWFVEAQGIEAAISLLKDHVKYQPSLVTQIIELVLMVCKRVKMYQDQARKCGAVSTLQRIIQAHPNEPTLQEGAEELVQALTRHVRYTTATRALLMLPVMANDGTLQEGGNSPDFSMGDASGGSSADEGNEKDLIGGALSKSHARPQQQFNSSPMTSSLIMNPVMDEGAGKFVFVNSTSEPIWTPTRCRIFRKTAKAPTNTSTRSRSQTPPPLGTTADSVISLPPATAAATSIKRPHTTPIGTRRRQSNTMGNNTDPPQRAQTPAGNGRTGTLISRRSPLALHKSLSRSTGSPYAAPPIPCVPAHPSIRPLL